MITILQIAENIILLSFMGLAYFVLEINRSRLGTATADLLVGLSFGLIAALVTAVPVTLADGATIDARAGPVILSAIVAGPIGAITAALCGGMARGFVGGSFAFAGVAVYAVYALTGFALRHLGVVRLESLTSLKAIATIILSSFAGAASMFFLIRPMELAVSWLLSDLPLILIANASSIAFSIACIGLVIGYTKKSAEVVKVNETLSIAKRAGRFGVWDYDIASGKLVWDDASREMHGIVADDFQGTYDDWARHVHPDDLERIQADFYAALSAEGGGIFDNEYRVRLPDGSENRVKGDAVVLRDANGQPTRVVGSNIDLTAIRKTENELAEAQSIAIQAQKIESIGQLTGGVAHDFNNLLAVILGNLELLAMKLKSKDFSHAEVQGYVEDSLNAALRGADLTQNMLAYARKARLSPIPMNLNDVVQQTDQWIRRTIETSVEIEKVLEEELWLTEADVSSMQTALVNLIVNARDAVGGSGRITIETANVVLDKKFFEAEGEQPAAGKYVMLSVQDNGVGMDATLRARIFDPFFTTKTVGQGTGLGLSTVQGFVKQSRGTIRVQSERGEGTRFQLYFPATQKHARETGQADAAERRTRTPGGATNRVLLVEDQAEVRTVLQRMLETEGYEVVTAASGDEAFELCRSDCRFDLVLTDIVMPGQLQGPALARALSEQHPDMRFIFITGYENQSSSDEEDFMPDITRLMKPLSHQKLLDAIRQSVGDKAT